MMNGLKKDVELWGSFVKGNESAFIALYNCYYPELFRFGVRISLDRDMTKDCLQEMFSSLWKKRQSLNDVHYVKAYLYKYLSRLVQASIKKDVKDKVRQKELVQHADFIMDYESKLINESNQSEEKRALHKALNLLTKRQAQIIKLKYFEGCDYHEIMAITGLKQKTVYNLAYEAISTLKKSLFPANREHLMTLDMN